MDVLIVWLALVIVVQAIAIRRLRHDLDDEAAVHEIAEREAEAYAAQLRDDLRLANLALMRAPSRKGGIINRARG